MVFDDAFGEVEVGDAIRVVTRGGIVCVRTIGAVNDGLSGCQPGGSTMLVFVKAAHPKIADAVFVLLHCAVLERLSGRVLRIPQSAWRLIDETNH